MTGIKEKIHSFVDYIPPINIVDSTSFTVHEKWLFMLPLLIH